MQYRSVGDSLYRLAYHGATLLLATTLSMPARFLLLQEWAHAHGVPLPKTNPKAMATAFRYEEEPQNMLQVCPPSQKAPPLIPAPGVLMVKMACLHPACGAFRCILPTCSLVDVQQQPAWLRVPVHRGSMPHTSTTSMGATTTFRHRCGGMPHSTLPCKTCSVLGCLHGCPVLMLGRARVHTDCKAQHCSGAWPGKPHALAVAPDLLPVERIADICYCTQCMPSQWVSLPTEALHPEPVAVSVSGMQ
jgi:hypothetical protein